MEGVYLQIKSINNRNTDGEDYVIIMLTNKFLIILLKNVKYDSRDINKSYYLLKSMNLETLGQDWRSL